MRKRKSKIAVRPPNRHDADVETRIFGLGCSGGTGHYGMPSLPAIAACCAACHCRLALLPAVAVCRYCMPLSHGGAACGNGVNSAGTFFSPPWVALP